MRLISYFQGSEDWYDWGGRIGMAGAGGFEPPNAGTKNRCLRPLGYAPSEVAGNIRLLLAARKHHGDDFRLTRPSISRRTRVNASGIQNNLKT